MKKTDKEYIYEIHIHAILHDPCMEQTLMNYLLAVFNLLMAVGYILFLSVCPCLIVLYHLPDGNSSNRLCVMSPAVYFGLP